MCCLDYLSVKHSLSKDMSVLLIAANLNRLIEKHKLAKIGPDMEAETVIYFYFIFFFQATLSRIQSITHYLYFRFWLSLIHFLKILFYIRFLLVLGLFGVTCWQKNSTRVFTTSCFYRKWFVRSEASYVALCAITWSTQFQSWLDLVDWSRDPERHLMKPSQH